ncbi:hypothetical protein M1439_03440 [Candidatus Marsarchaeota archaeon]|jgi:hypothetical protein|nr:hypothetical protein [Candidatus Marsarchaeota archaeon]MCL5092384.1 hypothetical protein [Candidatus Marsarchaeota archaeon]
MGSKENRKKAPCSTAEASRAGFHKFYILNAYSDAEVGEVAGSILKLDEVKELYISGGQCGFQIMARFNSVKTHREAENYMERHMAKGYGELICYSKLKNMAQRNAHKS